MYMHKKSICLFLSFFKFSHGYGLNLKTPFNAPGWLKKLCDKFSLLGSESTFSPFCSIANFNLWLLFNSTLNKCHKIVLWTCVYRCIWPIFLSIYWQYEPTIAFQPVFLDTFHQSVRFTWFYTQLSLALNSCFKPTKLP